VDLVEQSGVQALLDRLGAAPSTETSVVVVSFMGSSFLSWWCSRYDRTEARDLIGRSRVVRPNRA
jgi:hypothetical protein